jgi:dTDP-4-amino-4,6-dideoxygalactose transaminase
MPVHLFGQPADMGPILEIARANRLRIIEDAACALGAEYHGRKCGSLGDVGCFSFHPRKAITTGEGGMVTTDDDDLAERVRLLRNHGMVPLDGRPCFQDIGFNYRLTDFQGALGTVQMGRLEAILERRRELAEVYIQELAGIRGVILPTCLAGARHIWQSFVIRLPAPGVRDKVQQALARVGIETTIGTYAVSGQPSFERAGCWLPASRETFMQALSLPLHSRMSTADDQEISGHLAAQLASLAA